MILAAITCFEVLVEVRKLVCSHAAESKLLTTLFAIDLL